MFLQVSEVSIEHYSLIHWEDPMDMSLSPQSGTPTSGVSSSSKEGTLQYRSGTTYLGKEQWKSCYLVLRYGRVTHISPHLSCKKYVALSVSYRKHIVVGSHLVNFLHITNSS